MKFNSCENRKALMAALICATFLSGGVPAYAVGNPTTIQAVQQNSQVKGTVVDATGEPVIGASVVVKGTTNGTITDFDGNFVLNCPKNATLEISYIGYVSQSVKASPAMKITLKEDAKALDEVVVVGYGSVKKSTLTGAVTKMGSEGIENRSLARAETALQGQLAGVQVRTTTGEPGADMQIRVRGAASVNASSDPLYVVDGVPMETLSGINPSDIQSIEVLKDAASAAIYGSRGSNGVVMVTTKKGKSGKAKVSFNASYGISEMSKKMDVLSSQEWMNFRLRWTDASYLNAAKNKKVDASIADSNETRMQKLGLTSANYSYMFDERWMKYLDQSTRDAHTYTDNPEELSLLDWQDEFYRKAAVQDYGLTVSGGSDNTSYMFSGGYLNQDGIATGTDYERVSFRTKIESKINNFFTAGMNLAPTYIVQNGSGMANGKDSQAHKVLTSTPVSDNGVGYITNAHGNTKYNWAGSDSSPVYYMENNVNQSRVMRMVGSAFLRFTPIKDLSIEATGSAQYYDKDSNTYYTTDASGNWAQGEGVKSSGGHQTERSWQTLLQVVANYNFSLGDHNFNVMAGTSSERNSMGFSTNQQFSGPFANDAILGSFDGSKVNGKTNTVTEKTAKNLASFFGRVQYNYNEKYMLSGSLRYDGCSIFGANNKWGVFPAVSAGWMVSKEKFFQNLGVSSWLNTLKLRASYGETGNNNISNTAAYASLTAYNYAGQSGYSANSLGNADLGWEKTKSTDLAIDLGFLNNRIQLSLDYYTKKTTDLLYQVPVPGVSGFSKVWDNLGDIDNKGFEIELNTKNFIGTFQWNTSFNISYNQNTVKSLGVDDTPVYSGFSSGQNSNVLMVDKAINTFYMYNAVGVWQSQSEIDAYAKECGVTKLLFGSKTIQPGDIRYSDPNHDGVFNDEDKEFLGQPSPKFVYGMTNTFKYKDFDLSILMTAQTGGKIYGVFGRAFDRPSMGASSNVLGCWRNAWWSEAEPGDGKTPYILSSTTGTTLDSRWLYSSDYLRIKNLTLGYKLPINPKFISYARVYVSIENLKTWDNYYGGYSPEAANTASSTSPGGQSAVGLDYGSYPLSRTYTIGINVNF